MTKRSERNDLLVGLDVGTSKIAAIVGEVSPAGQVNVVGFGTHPSRGLKKGVVVNIEATVQSIKRAVEEAELMAGCRIQSGSCARVGTAARAPAPASPASIARRSKISVTCYPTPHWPPLAIMRSTVSRASSVILSSSARTLFAPNQSAVSARYAL